MAELGQTSEQPFQNLTRLSLNDLPELESIYWTPLGFPVLEDVIISRCPKLRRLPFNSKSAIGNQLRLDLDEEWIKDVEWEDKTTKQRFSGLNNRDFPMMAEEQKKMGDLESHPTQNKVLVGTTKSGERATASSISGKKVLQSEINVAGVALEPRHTHKVSTSEVLESSTIYAPASEGFR